MKYILHVFLKEVREMFRDKRVRTAAIFGPIILIFIVTGLFGFIAGTVGKRENQRVHVIKTTAPELEILKKGGIQVIEVDDREAGIAQVKSGKARVLLEFLPPNPEGQTLVNAYLDPKNQTGDIALTVVKSIYAEVNRALLSKVLEVKGVPASAQEHLKIERKEVTVGEKGGASDLIVTLLPYLIVIWAFYGGMSIASDLVAGEKEKNTLETLLVTPVRRTEIVLGKFLALGAISLISSLTSVFGLGIVALVKMPGSDVLFKNGTGLTLASGTIIVVLMLPLVALFSALLIAISSISRNPREAQTYLGQVSFIVILPAMFSQFIGLMDAGSAFWVNFVPILNVANGMRLALLGKPDMAGVAVSVGVSLVLALIALRATVVLFNREEVLVRV